MPIITNICIFCKEEQLKPHYEYDISAYGKGQIQACKKCYDYISHWFWKAEEFGG